MSDELIRALEESDYHLANERERVAALRQEIADARAALGEGWLAGGVSLAEGIRRKTMALEYELASDHCAERPRVLYEGKGFDWALARIREGAHVRRAEWDGGVGRLTYATYATVGEWVYGSRRILLYSADGSYILWWPHPDDLLAVDWCVA